MKTPQTNKQTNKQTNFFIALAYFICILISCTKESTSIESEITFEKELATFKGLPVNHRFSTPLEELETTHDKNNLRVVYAKIKTKIAQQKGLAYKATEEALPDPETIVAGVEMVIEQFPFSNMGEEFVDDSKLDSIQIAEIEKEFQLKQELEATEHWEMIKNDFPTLTEAEIANNLDIIDEYYSQNLDYVTLEAIAENENKLIQKLTTKKLYKSSDIDDDINCLTQNIATLFGFNPVKSIYAASKAKEIAEETIKHHYTSSNGVPITGGNSVNNTYKHMVFIAFLAQKYFTISNKSNRLQFAETIGDRHEYCNSNEDDSREMDFHNNAIGRKIWDDNTSYQKVASLTVGLRTPSDPKLREEIRKRIDRFSCFIIKEREDRFPESQQTRNLTIPEVIGKIQNTQAHIPVYFIGPIKESTYIFEKQSVGFETIECDDRNSQGNAGVPTRGNPDGPAMCQRELFITVQKEVIPCFKL